MKFTPKSAEERLKELSQGLAEVIEARWYRNKATTRKILLTLVSDAERGFPTTVMIHEGDDLYDGFAEVLR